jgi:phospholipid-binding lipoprotein MlaA
MPNLVLFAAIGLSLCAGCASNPPDKADPWRGSNTFFYNFNDGFDRVALKPASDVYVKIFPKFIRTGISNGFDNLVYFNVVFNDLLQGKWGQGLGDFGRMAANSTIGVGGIFDVATNWGLPAHENDFGITLGKWGSGPGPYMVLPLFGPSSLRDAPGLGVEILATPTTWLGLPLEVSAPLYATQTIDARSNSEVLARFRNDTALDPYIFTRDAYLQYRQARILEGTTRPDQSIYDEDDDTGATTRPASKDGD